MVRGADPLDSFNPWGYAALTRSTRLMITREES